MRRLTPSSSPCTSRYHSQKQRQDDENADLGPKWGDAELGTFFRCFVENRGDFNSIADSLKGRTVGMCIALFETNKAYLSLQHEHPYETAIQTFVSNVHEREGQRLQQPCGTVETQGEGNGVVTRENGHPDQNGVEPHRRLGEAEGEGAPAAKRSRRDQDKDEVAGNGVLLGPPAALIIPPTSSTEGEETISGNIEMGDGNGTTVDGRIRGLPRPVAIKVPVSAGKAVGRRTHRTPTKRQQRGTDVDAIETAVAVLASGGDRKQQAKGRAAAQHATPRKSSANGGPASASKNSKRSVDRKMKGGGGDDTVNGDESDEKASSQRKRKRKLFPKDDGDDFFASLNVLCDATFMIEQGDHEETTTGTVAQKKKGGGTRGADAAAPGKAKAAGRQRSKKKPKDSASTGAKKEGTATGAASARDKKSRTSANSSGKGGMMSLADKIGQPMHWRGSGMREAVRGTRRRKPTFNPLGYIGRCSSVLADKVEKERKRDWRPYPYFTQQKKLMHCLSPGLRRWCSYEWFYSAIDQPWFFNKTDPFPCHVVQTELGRTRLTRTEWSMVRKAMGKPRRLSKAFLNQERDSLERHRQVSREHFKIKKSQHQQLAALVPDNSPMPLTVGQKVLARHPKMLRQIADGSILTSQVGGQRFRVQFNQKDLGAEIVEDIDIMPIPDDAQPQFEADTQASLMASMTTNPYVFGGVAAIDPNENALRMMAIMEGMQHGEAAGVMGGIGYEPGPVMMPSADPGIEDQMSLLYKLSQELDTKENLVQRLAKMNTDAEKGMLEKSQNGTFPEAFRIQYATLVAELPRVNREIQETLITMEAKKHQILEALRVNFEIQQSIAVPVLMQTPQEILASSRDRAKTMIECYFNSLRLRDKPGAWKPETDFGDHWDISSPKSARPSVTPMVKELIVSCVAAFIAIQVYAEHSASAEDINVLMDSIHEMLKPRSIANSRFFNVIGGVLNDVAVLLQPTSRLPIIAAG